ncbi:hypothetical protein GOODEAATRI_012171, partial [Goodea atripinnis]
QVIAALRETGVLDNTAVIFTADHGELAMEHRQFYKMSMFEGSSHVPLLIMGPEVKSGLQVQQLVSLVDLYPTVLDVKVDKDELHNVVLRFPDVQAKLDMLLRSIVDYPKVSSAVHLYNNKSFAAWRDSLGRDYAEVIANLRWHADWQKDILANEKAIDTWLHGSSRTFYG